MQTFDCSLASSVAEDGRVKQHYLRQSHRDIHDYYGMYSLTIRACHEERALDRHVWRDGLLAGWESEVGGRVGLAWIG
eukprot:363760-Chlamydomonas_euryale.AAC.1